MEFSIKFLKDNRLLNVAIIIVGIAIALFLISLFLFSILILNVSIIFFVIGITVLQFLKTKRIEEKVEEISPKDEYSKQKSTILNRFPPIFYYLNHNIINDINNIIIKGKYIQHEVGKQAIAKTGKAEGKFLFLGGKIEGKKEDEIIQTTEYKETESLACVNIMINLLDRKKIILDLLELQNEQSDTTAKKFTEGKINYYLHKSFLSFNEFDSKLIDYNGNKAEFDKIARIIQDYLRKYLDDSFIEKFQEKVQANLSDHTIITGNFELQTSDDETMTFTLNHPLTQRKFHNSKNITLFFTVQKSYLNPAILPILISTRKFFGACFAKIFYWDKESLTLTLFPIAIFS